MRHTPPAHERLQLIEIQWLYQVRVESSHVRSFLIFVASMPCHRDQQHFGILLAQYRCDVLPGDARKSDIYQRDLGMKTLDRCNRLRTAVGD